MVTTTYNVREQLQELLIQAGLPAEAHLMAMHLTEIEEETNNFLDQLTAFRAHARHEDPVAAQEALVEISLALQHIADHLQAVTPMLDRELGVGEDD
jgi:septation ring formation regulator EzrA